MLDILTFEICLFISRSIHFVWINRCFAEAGSFGLQNLRAAGFWVFVYGLMAYLPAYSIPERDVKKPRLRHYFLAIFLPFIFVIPVAFVVHLVHPVKTHFEPSHK